MPNHRPACEGRIDMSHVMFRSRFFVGRSCDPLSMRHPLALVAPMICVATALACGHAAADVPVGAGPTDYSVQQQPAPGSCQYRRSASGQSLPDPVCTPGAISPKVTEETLDTTICRSGYTKSIRPPKDITEAEKRANAAAYGYSGRLSAVEFDHVVSAAVTHFSSILAGQGVDGMPLTRPGDTA